MKHYGLRASQRHERRLKVSKLKQGDKVIVYGHIVRVDGNYATVAWDSTTTSANVPLSKIEPVRPVEKGSE